MSPITMIVVAIAVLTVVIVVCTVCIGALLADISNELRRLGLYK